MDQRLLQKKVNPDDRINGRRGSIYRFVVRKGKLNYYDLLYLSQILVTRPER